MSDAEGIANLLHEIGLSRVQLLPFHQMGERKYEFLNREYEMTGVKALHPEDLTEYQKVYSTGRRIRNHLLTAMARSCSYRV